LPDLDEKFDGISLGRALLEQVAIRGMAHITGGGFYENIPRMFFAEEGKTRGFDAVIKNGSWPIPPIFARIASGVRGGGLTGQAACESGAQLLETDAALRKLMFNTYNMGIGFVLALAPEDGGRAMEFLNGAGFPARAIGRVEAGGSGELRFE
jgi:phosphoribosylformylglycinamidine cyclo-ligase